MKKIWPQMLILVSILGLTGIFAGALRHHQNQLAQADFALLANRTQVELTRRVSLPVYGMMGARGMFAGVGRDREITQVEFSRYVRSRHLEREFPGVQSMGLIRPVRRSGLDSFELAQQGDGSDGFAVQTAGDHEDLYVVTTVEPAAQNAHLIGWDLHAQSSLFETAELARVSGQPALSPLVILPEVPAAAPNGYWLMLPVYRDVLTDPDGLIAIIYASISLSEVMEGLEQISGLLLSCEVISSSQRVPSEARYTQVLPIEVGGRSLSLLVESTPMFERIHQSYVIIVTGLFGLVTGLLMMYVTTLVRRQRARAVAMAYSLSGDLKDAQRVAGDVHAEMHQLYRALAQHTLVSVTDIKGTIIEANESFCRVSGYTRSELIGQNHRLINSGHHPQSFWIEMWRTISSGKVWVAEVCNRAKDGSLYWVDSMIAPIATRKDGKVDRYLSIRHDVTERKKLENHLRSAKVEAEQANQAKSQFLANMSHEIRTPMNGIMGMIELMLGTGLTPEQKDYVRTAYSSTEALLTIINDVLDFSKIDAGHMEVESITYDLKAVVYDTVALFRSRVQTDAVELLVEVGPDVPELLSGDPNRVRQILSNLVSNALKFTERGHVLVSIRASEGAVRVEVLDTGIGIPEDRADSLFNAFTQVDASTARKHGGTGLGLAISRELALLMAGDLAVGSRLGEGSVFTLTLPLALPDEGTATVAISPQSAAGTRVLVVGGSDLSRGILYRQLQRLGFDASETSGDQQVLDSTLDSTLASAREGRVFDVVIIDGDRDAEVVRRWIEGVEKHPELSPIFIRYSAYGSLGASESGSSWSGVSCILTVLMKPCSDVTTAEVILTAVRGQQQTATSPSTSLLPEQPSTFAVSILLVDDNAVNQKLAKAMLTRLGAEVALADDGLEAVAAAAKQSYDIIFMDCQMPNLDGYGATQQIRCREAALGVNRTPIIALTANAMPGDREKCLATGMDDYISKPLRADDLRAMLATWCPSGSQAGGDLQT